MNTKNNFLKQSNNQTSFQTTARVDCAIPSTREFEKSFDRAERRFDANKKDN
jgi:hypothetical protein